MGGAWTARLPRRLFILSETCRLDYATASKWSRWMNPGFDKPHAAGVIVYPVSVILGSLPSYSVLDLYLLLVTFARIRGTKHRKHKLKSTNSRKDLGHHID
jgi:hypothetical protein